MDYIIELRLAYSEINKVLGNWAVIWSIELPFWFSKHSSKANKYNHGDLSVTPINEWFNAHLGQ